MIEDIELETLINDVYEYYGFDFGSYSRASLKRRVSRVFYLDGFKHFHDFLSKVRTDPEYCKRMIDEITVNVTEMFRDPSFYLTLRKEVLPLLGTKPFIRIWHAGCSTGEEVYSMAIMLKEEGLLHKSILYATDINATVLETAKSGIFPLRMIKDYADNYRDAGGRKIFRIIISPITVLQNLMKAFLKKWFSHSIIWFQTIHLMSLTLFYAAMF